MKLTSADIQRAMEWLLPLGVCCAEAQADGVPCGDAHGDCLDCARAEAVRRLLLLMAMEDASTAAAVR